MKTKIIYLLVGIVTGVLGTTYWRHVVSPGDGALPDLPAPYYTSVFENNAVRIVDHRLEPGQAEPMHEHPPMFVYFTSDANVEISTPDGSVFQEALVQGSTMELPRLTHAIENIGDTSLRSILVEFK